MFSYFLLSYQYLEIFILVKVSICSVYYNAINSQCSVHFCLSSTTVLPLLFSVSSFSEKNSKCE